MREKYGTAINDSPMAVPHSADRRHGLAEGGKEGQEGTEIEGQFALGVALDCGEHDQSSDRRKCRFDYSQHVCSALGRNEVPFLGCELFSPNRKRADRCAGDPELAHPGQKLQHDAFDLAPQLDMPPFVIKPHTSDGEDQHPAQRRQRGARSMPTCVS